MPTALAGPGSPCPVRLAVPCYVASIIDRLPLYETDETIGPIIKDTSNWSSIPYLAEFTKCYNALTDTPHFKPTDAYNPSDQSRLLHALFNPTTHSYTLDRCALAANMHAQHTFAYAALKLDYDLLLDGQRQAAPHHRARLRACAVPGATIPFATTFITDANSYTNLQTAFIYCNLLGLPHPFITSQPCCHPNCSRRTEDDEDATNPLSPRNHRLAYHHLSCAAGGLLKARHDGLAAEIATVLNDEAGYLCTLKAGLGSSTTGGEQVDIVARAWWRSARPLAIDVTVSNPMLPTYIKNAVDDARSVLRLRSKHKHDKHGPGCEAMERDFASAVYSTFGGYYTSRRDLSGTLDNIFKESIAADKAAGGTGWAPAQRKLRARESIAAALHRGSATMASLLPTGEATPQPIRRRRNDLVFRRQRDAFY